MVGALIGMRTGRAVKGLVGAWKVRLCRAKPPEGGRKHGQPAMYVRDRQPGQPGVGVLQPSPWHQPHTRGVGSSVGAPRSQRS
jgi:hypothetical protein